MWTVPRGDTLGSDKIFKCNFGIFAIYFGL